MDRSNETVVLEEMRRTGIEVFSRLLRSVACWGPVNRN